MARILIIDDDESVRDVLEYILTESGHEVEQADDGTTGLDRFHDKRYDLIITDILMPEKEGIEMIREIRQLDPDIRIIAISGGGSLHAEEYLNFAVKFGASATLTKPIDRALLLQKIDEILTGMS
ncbi:MAG: response regulator [Candidatus Sumerlaeia bacterium]